MHQINDYPDFASIIPVERSLIAKLLHDTDGNIFYDIYEQIKPSDFYDPVCSQIYSAIEYLLIDQKNKTDLAIILSRLSTENDKKLAKVLYKTISGQTSDISGASKQIINASRIRQIFRISDDVKYSIIDNKLTAETLIDKLEKDLFTISEHRTDSFDMPVNCVDDTLNRLRIRKEGIVAGTPSFLKPIDDMVCGFEPGHMIVIAGRPSAGKSLIALQILIENARIGNAVGFFNLDMTKEMLMERIISYMTLIPLHKIRSGQLNKRELDWIDGVVPEIKKLKILIDSQGTLTPQEFISRSRRMKMRHPDLSLVCVDYIQLMKCVGIGNRNDELAYISSTLKSAAKDIGVPIMTISQLNRKVEDRPDKRPLMSDLRESGAIEQDSDIIMLLYRDGYYNKGNNTNELEINIAKQRNGPTGMVKLKIDLPTQHITI